MGMKESGYAGLVADRSKLAQYLPEQG